MTSNAPFSRFAAACVAVVPVLAASAIGSAATLPAIPGWYAGLAKPDFTPPNGAFGPVWTMLYIGMAIAAYRVLRRPGGGRAPLVAFLVQIALNGFWSVAFFGLRNPGLGLAVIAALWIAIAWTMVLFFRQDRWAGALFAPYLAWVSYAALLNAAIVRLNG